MKKRITITAAVMLVAGSYAATLEDWQFNDANGTALNAVTNTGTVGTSWNFGGPQVQAGSLNIGDATYYKWNPGGGTTYRTAEFTEVTTGKYVFAFVISDWNLGGSDGVGDTGNGIKFNFGHTTNGSAQLEFEVSQDTSDIRVRSQNSNDGNLTGTDAQHQLGGLNLTNTAPVTVELVVDLDTGDWSTSIGYQTNTADLVANGTGMTMLDRIQLIVDASNGSGWEYGGVPGTATEFVKIDSITLAEWEEEVYDPWNKLEFWGFDKDPANQAFGANWNNSGSLDSIWNYGGPGEIATDGFGSLVVSNHSGQVFRKLPKAGTANANGSGDVYDVAFTSGVYRLEMDFASWDFPAGADSGQLQLTLASDGSEVVRIRLRPNTAGDGAWIQLMGVESGIRQYNTYGQGAGSTNKTAATSAMIEFDFDNDTINYFIDGGEPKKTATTFDAAGFDQIVFNTDANWSPNNVVTIDAMGLYRYVAPADTNTTPSSLWNDWIAIYPGVGGNTNLLDHGDSDDLDNLTEYAYGGDPADGGNQGNVPVRSLVEDGGASYIEYIYYARDDAGDRGLAYLLSTETDLVSGSGWINDHYEVVGTNTNTGIPGFNAVTNRMSAVPEDKRFLRLQIQFAP